MTENYPPRLKRALIQNQLWEARFALDICRKPVARGDAFCVAGCLFRCAACMVQALFALNKETVNSVPARPGEHPEQLETSVERLENLLAAVERLRAS